MPKDTMSILGLYRFDPTIFQSLVTPSAEWFDKETLINNLLMECAEFEILYTDPEFMKWALEQWSKKQSPIWEKQIATMEYEYDAIYNYDRHENWTDTETRGVKTTITGTNTKTLKETPGETTTLSEKGYEAVNFVDKEKTAKGGTNNSVLTDSLNTTNQDSGTNTIKRDGRAYGNIGVTSTQELIKQERDIIKYNIYDIIIDDFKNRFCLMIY